MDRLTDELGLAKPAHAEEVDRARGEDENSNVGSLMGNRKAGVPVTDKNARRDEFSGEGDTLFGQVLPCGL
jgi:hypothetical protein